MWRAVPDVVDLEVGARTELAQSSDHTRLVQASHDSQGSVWADLAGGQKAERAGDRLAGVRALLGAGAAEVHEHHVGVKASQLPDRRAELDERLQLQLNPELLR